jgi:hypothetical protein
MGGGQKESVKSQQARVRGAWQTRLLTVVRILQRKPHTPQSGQAGQSRAGGNRRDEMRVLTQSGNGAPAVKSSPMIGDH